MSALVLAVLIEDGAFMGALTAVLAALWWAIKHLYAKCSLLNEKVESMSRVLGESSTIVEAVQHCSGGENCPVKRMHPEPLAHCRKRGQPPPGKPPAGAPGK